MDSLRLYMVLLGCELAGRHTEQHDIFFGIAGSLADLVPQIKAFWSEAKKMHIDAWREVNSVDGYSIIVSEKNSPLLTPQHKKLFFLNLGGYRESKFEEQHHILLSVEESSGAAIKKARATSFFRENRFDGANSHIDDKYGIDVDDIHLVEEIIPGYLKEKYRIDLAPTADLPDDPIHLGYLKLSSLKA